MSFRQVSDKDKGKDVKCPGFEPQTWRKSLCKLCFKTRGEHGENTAGKSSQESGANGARQKASSGGGGGVGSGSGNTSSSSAASPASVSDKRVGAQSSNTNSGGAKKTADVKNGSPVSKTKTVTSTSGAAKSTKTNGASVKSGNKDGSAKDSTSKHETDNINTGSSRDKNTTPSSTKATTKAGDDVAERSKSENDTLRKSASTRSKISTDSSTAGKDKHSDEKSAVETKEKSTARGSSGGSAKTAGKGGGGKVAELGKKLSSTSDANGTPLDTKKDGVKRSTGAKTTSNSASKSTAPPTTTIAQQGQPLRKSEATTSKTNDEKHHPVTSQARETSKLSDKKSKSQESSSSSPNPQTTTPTGVSGSSIRCKQQQDVLEDLDDIGDDTFVAQGSLRGLVFERSVDAPVKKMAAESEYTMDISREEAMLEGTRMLMDNLREKVMNLEEKCDKLEREKKALSELLSVKKREMNTAIDDLSYDISCLEEKKNSLEVENRRLLERLKLPESERFSMQSQTQELSELEKKVDDYDNFCFDLKNENSTLRQELGEVKLEMDEMYDRFREDESLEFRELQRELENCSKNCRILQFKLRKAERRYEQSEADRNHFEERMRQTQMRYETEDDRDHIRELEEEMKMAKDVSVRLHDELEIVEERRAKFEEEAELLRAALRQSENKRGAAENEIDRLNLEFDKLRTASPDSDGQPPAPVLTLPRKQPSLTMSSRESSLEHDVTQLLQNLEDAKERENDLREQLKFAEEENKIRRKKLSDLEEENESLSLQLQKLSSAKSGKFLRKSPDQQPDDKRVITEAEHELRMQMDLAENEIKVLRRKMNDMEQENENLLSEIRFLQGTLSRRSKQNSPIDLTGQSEDDYHRRVSSMMEDMDELKWKLIEKDREVDKLTKQMEARAVTRKAGLQRSRSLDSDCQVDLKRQLDLVQQEADILKHKIRELELENERLVSENRKLQLISHRKVPSIQADDAAIQNIELKDKVRQLERENAALRDRIISIDERTHMLSREVTKAKSRGFSLDDTVEAHDLREKLHLVEQESTVLRRKMCELEAENSKLTRELRKYKGSETPKDKVSVKEASIQDLRERIVELEDEIGDMLVIIKSREQSNSELEEEIESYKDQIDHMVGVFRSRERDLCDEIQSMDQKNSVLSNLLEIVTERADSMHRELERHQGDGSSRSDRSPSVTSAVSDTSTGSDDVFLQPPSEQGGKSDLQKQWEELFKKRIESLECLLAEERHKVHAVEKKMLMTQQDSAPSSTLLDTTMYEREKDILQKELVVCQQQLEDANTQVVELKKRLERLQTDHDNIKKELEKFKDELNTERVRSRTPEPAKPTRASVDTKGSGAAWRWEKQELEKQVKDYKKKYDDLHRQTLRNPKLKSAVEEGGDGSKDKLEKDMKNMKEECKKHCKRIEELEVKLKQTNAQWEEVKGDLEKRAATEQEKKNDIIKQKDSIISQQKDAMAQKDAIYREKEESVIAKEKDLNQFKDRVTLLTNSIKQKEDDVNKMSELLKHREALLSEKEINVRQLNEKIRQRDDRLKEKDDILENLNNKVAKKEMDCSEKENQIKSVRKQLSDLERDIEKLKGDISERENKSAVLEKKLEEKENQSREIERDLKCTKDDLRATKEKLEKSISELKTEKESSAEELKKTKELLKKKEDRWKREKSKLDLDLKQAKEQVHSMELSKTMRQGDLIRTINKEKQSLIDEKHAQAEQIKALKLEMDKSTKSWNSERDDLNKTIKEKAKFIEENEKTTENLRKELEKVKLQLEKESKKLKEKNQKSQTSLSTKEKDWEQEKNMLQKRLEAETLILKSEKEASEKRNETKVKSLNDEVKHLQGELEAMRIECASQKEQLEKTQRKLTDMKTKYDIESSSFREERFTLERRAKEGDDKSKLVAELQRTVDDLRFKNRDLERTRTELLNKMSMDKSTCDIEKASLQTKINQLEEQQSSTTRTRSSKSNQTWEKERTDQKRLLTESHNLALELQQQLKASEKSRESERVALEAQLDQQNRKRTDDLIESKKKEDEIREKSIQLTTLQKAMIDLQDKIKRDRENWQMERTELRRRLDDCKRSQKNDKEKMDELMIELNKLKILAPVLSESEKIPHTQSSKVTSATTIRLSSSTKTSKEPTPRRSISPRPADKQTELMQQIPASPIDERFVSYLTEALNQISKVTDNMNQRVDIKSPPVLRRCYTSSESEQTSGKSYADSGIVQTDLIEPSIASKVESSDDKRRSRSIIKRSFSYTPAELSIPITHVQSVPPARSSRYASGTRSAATSRDPSPDKYGVRRITNYPLPTRGFLISPSHTPRKYVNASDDAQTDVLSSSNVSKLVEKLSRVDSSGSDDTGTPTSHTRQGSLRKLQKSASVDSAPLDENLWVQIPVEHLPQETRSAEVSGSFSFNRSQSPFGHSPASQASGGTDSNVLQPPQPSPSSTGSVSPRTARRKFYEDYNTVVLPSSGLQPPERRYSHGAMSSYKVQHSNSIDSSLSPKKTLAHIEIRGGKITVSDQKDQSASPRSPSPSLPSPSRPSPSKSPSVEATTSKEKRSLFGSKKSSSVDNPSVMSSIARIGVQGALPPAVRTSVDIPDVSKHTGSGTVATTLRKLFKRSSSLEGGATSPTTSSQSASTVYRDSSESSISSKLSRQISLGSVTSSRTDGSPFDVLYWLADIQQAPSLTPKFLKPRSPANRRRPKRWQSMEKASERPIIIPNMADEESGRSENVVIVRREVFTPIKVWHFSETPV